jgi:hypothetical protein
MSTGRRQLQQQEGREHGRQIQTESSPCPPDRVGGERTLVSGDYHCSNHLLVTWTGCSNGASTSLLCQEGRLCSSLPCPQPHCPLDLSTMVRGYVLGRHFAYTSSLHGQSAMKLVDGRSSYALLPHCSCSLDSVGD